MDVTVGPGVTQRCEKHQPAEQTGNLRKRLASPQFQRVFSRQRVGYDVQAAISSGFRVRLNPYIGPICTVEPTLKLILYHSG